jgi:hypothetical protein
VYRGILHKGWTLKYIYIGCTLPPICQAASIQRRNDDIIWWILTVIWQSEVNLQLIWSNFNYINLTKILWHIRSHNSQPLKLAGEATKFIDYKTRAAWQEKCEENSTNYKRHLNSLMLNYSRACRVGTRCLIHKAHLGFWRKFWQFSLIKIYNFVKLCNSFYIWMPSLNYKGRY